MGFKGIQGDPKGTKPLPRPSKLDSEFGPRQSYFCNAHNQNFDSKQGEYKEESQIDSLFELAVYNPLPFSPVSANRSGQMNLVPESSIQPF